MKNVDQVKVFVLDNVGKVCLPTKPRRARQLLDQGRAIVKQVVPFTIQLKRVVKDPIGFFKMGVDDGAKYVGVAVKNIKTDEIVFRAEVTHRQDVSRKVEERRNYRKARRFRLRNRKPRFNNRIKINKLVPSQRQKKDVILRVLVDLKKKLNITEVKVEEVFFNHAKYNYGKFFSLVEIGKKYLKEQIIKLGLSYETTHGYTTKEIRLKLGLSKRHSNDACSILESNRIKCIEYFIKPKRSKIWECNPTKTCVEKNGFKHYDLVKSFHRTKKIIIGSIRSLKKNVITLRTKFDDNFAVSYSKTKILQRFNGLIYTF